jgi:hypothetical protein
LEYEQLSQYSGYAASYTSQESGFESRKGMIFSIAPRLCDPTLTVPNIKWVPATVFSLVKRQEHKAPH